MNTMDICKETKWLCENAKSLEKFSGRWVVFSSHDGLMRSCDSVATAIKSVRPSKSKISPFLFHVPSKEELVSPFPVVAKK